RIRAIRLVRPGSGYENQQDTELHQQASRPGILHPWRLLISSSPPIPPFDPNSPRTRDRGRQPIPTGCAQQGGCGWTGTTNGNKDARIYLHQASNGKQVAGLLVWPRSPANEIIYTARIERLGG